MPSRTYNTLAAGKPIIGIVDAGSELAQVIQEETVGWVVPPGRPDRAVRLRYCPGKRRKAGPDISWDG